MLPPRDDQEAEMLIRDMESHYRKALLSFQEDDRYYEGDLEEDIPFPEGYDKTIPTTARAIVDEAVDNIDPYDLQIKYAPRGFSETAQENAEEVSRFLKNMWLYWRATTYDIDVLRDFQKNLFKNGKAVFKILPDWTLWPTLSDYTKKKLVKEGGIEAVTKRAKAINELRESNFPVIIRSLSPRHVMEDPTVNSRKLFVVERYDGNSIEIENLYHEFLPDIMSYPTGAGDSPYVIHELWTASYIDADGDLIEGQHYIYVNYVKVMKEKNKYHELPYVIKYSGLGRETYEGDPDIKATGFFTTQVKSMLRAEVRRVSQFDALMSQTAFPIAFLPEEVRDDDIGMSPGDMNFVPQSVLENFDKIFLVAKLPESAYLTSLNMIQNSIERGTTQRAVRGAGVPGTDSAAQLQMITSQAKLRLEPVKRASEEAVDQVNSLVLKFVEHVFEEKVSVFGAEALGPDRYTLRPNQIKGKYRTRTTFMPSEEQIKERKLLVASEAISKAGMNKYDAYSLAGFENPMEMIARDLVYKMMEEPAVMRQLQKRLMETWGLDTDELTLQEAVESMEITKFVQALQEQLQASTSAPPAGGGQGESGSAPAPQAIGAPTAQPMSTGGEDQFAQMQGAIQ